MSTELNGTTLRAAGNRSNERSHLRFDRRFPKLGVLRLQRSSETSDPEEFRKRNDYLTQLAAMGRGEELRAFASGEISINAIVEAFARFSVTSFLEDIRADFAARTVAVVASAVSAQSTAAVADLRLGILTASSPIGNAHPQLDRPLWSTAIDEVIPSMGELVRKSRLRYTTSIRALQRKLAVYTAENDAFEVLADLSGATWDALEQARMRGVSVLRLRTLTALSQEERRTSLRETNTRLNAAVFVTLRTLPRLAWNALGEISEYLVNQDLVNTLDRLRPDERQELRESALKLGKTPNFADLAKLTKTDWARFSRNWGGSSADWNHMRRALSAVLTDLLGTSHHEFRYQLMERIRLKTERERIPDLSPKLFWKIVELLPPEANQFPVTIVLTGVRISEYERLDRANLKPRTHVVVIPGDKTPGSVRDAHISPEYWPYVDAAVPAPREYGWLRRKWKEACAKLDVFDVTLHDLRHCHGQWALDGGAQEQSVQTTLGHTSPAMTRRYTKSLQKGEVARALRTILQQPEKLPAGTE